VGQSQGLSRDSPIAAQALGQEKRNTKKLQGRRRRRRRRRRIGDTHHHNEIIIRAHWWVDVEDDIRRDNLERQLGAPLDLLPIKSPIMSTVPSRGMLGTILSRRRARRISGCTLRTWNAVMTPAPGGVVDGR
jgi:hypothetical protein